ncbi:protein phosphatase CheZ [Aquabacter cavernae]|uniref:protein phosphatase CheZ n=1 Tax=Aquabacter cavernae TaxID=2496029 RepID=UPI001FE01266|nr:protein phosphatase CheZ [Aquabacter cavernae]
MPTSMRPFRIENAVHSKTGTSNVVATIPLDQLDRILTELAALRADLARATRLSPEIETEDSKGVLWQGLETIREAIANTKSEIASIQAGHHSGANLDRATYELSAVVSDTEAATEVILSAAENIDDLVKRLGRDLTGEQKDIAHQIHDNAVQIFEACNFQDITGQRISKVVGLMQFVEHHISRMIAIWGGPEDLHRMAGDLKKEREREGDAALLNGPALSSDNNVVSQDDIDSLFS